MDSIPATYRVTETLPDGRALRMRPIRPGDRDRLREEFLKLSPESVRERFFNAKLDLTPQELSFLTEVDQFLHVALVAEIGSAKLWLPAGVGRFVRDGDRPERCEAAITVAEDLHGNGIGWILLRQLLHCARELGVTRFDASVLPENRAMKHLLQKTGLPLESDTEDGVLVYSLTL